MITTTDEARPDHWAYSWHECDSSHTRLSVNINNSSLTDTQKIVLTKFLAKFQRGAAEEYFSTST